MTDETDRETAARREYALAMVPRVLVALAGACTLSGIVGFGMIVWGDGPPPLPLLLAPPVVVLLAAPCFVFLRRDGAGDE